MFTIWNVSFNQKSSWWIFSKFKYLNYNHDYIFAKNCFLLASALVENINTFGFKTQGTMLAQPYIPRTASTSSLANHPNTSLANHLNTSFANHSNTSLANHPNNSLANYSTSSLAVNHPNTALLNGRWAFYAPYMKNGRHFKGFLILLQYHWKE